MSEKQRARLNDLLHKILTEKQRLSNEEARELKTLYGLLQKEMDSKKSMAEKLQFELFMSKIDDIFHLNRELEKELARKQEKEFFSQLPLDKKAQYLEEKIKTIENSSSWHKLTKEEKDEQAKKDFENFDEFYADYVRKHGKSL